MLGWGRANGSTARERRLQTLKLESHRQRPTREATGELPFLACQCNRGWANPPKPTPLWEPLCEAQPEPLVPRSQRLLACRSPPASPGSRGAPRGRGRRVRLGGLFSPRSPAGLPAAVPTLLAVPGRVPSFGSVRTVFPCTSWPAEGTKLQRCPVPGSLPTLPLAQLDSLVPLHRPQQTPLLEAPTALYAEASPSFPLPCWRGHCRAVRGRHRLGTRSQACVQTGPRPGASGGGAKPNFQNGAKALGSPRLCRGTVSVSP